MLNRRIRPGHKIKYKIKKKLGWTGLPKLILYRGYASENKLHLTGYLTEDKGLEKPSEDNTTWQNMVAMLKRYSSENFPFTPIKIKVSNHSYGTQTSFDGTFHLEIEQQSELPSEHTEWKSYFAGCTERLTEDEAKLTATGEDMLPAKSAAYGVISDIDDTIIVSHSTQILRKLWLLLFRNSKTRKPFPGVDAFYQALERGIDNRKNNPFFYVSSSEWNLYDLLEDFCEHNQLPKGVFLLQQLKTGLLKFRKSGGGSHEHKYDKIKHLLHTYPDLQFVLIGDNGQMDPQIYYRIASEFPDRIKAIYIRAVSKKKNPVRSDLEQLEIPVVFTKDSTNAAIHAAKIGLIPTGSIAAIKRDALKDQEVELNKKVFLKD